MSLGLSSSSFASIERKQFIYCSNCLLQYNSKQELEVHQKKCNPHKEADISITIGGERGKSAIDCLTNKGWQVSASPILKHVSLQSLSWQGACVSVVGSCSVGKTFFTNLLINGQLGGPRKQNQNAPKRPASIDLCYYDNIEAGNSIFKFTVIDTPGMNTNIDCNEHTATAILNDASNQAAKLAISAQADQQQPKLFIDEKSPTSPAAASSPKPAKLSPFAQKFAANSQSAAAQKRLTSVCEVEKLAQKHVIEKQKATHIPLKQIEQLLKVQQVNETFIMDLFCEVSSHVIFLANGYTRSEQQQLYSLVDKFDNKTRKILAIINYPALSNAEALAKFKVRLILFLYNFFF